MNRCSSLLGLLLGKKLSFEDEIYKFKAMYSSLYSFSKQGFPALRPLSVAEVWCIPFFSCEAGVRVA